MDFSICILPKNTATGPLGSPCRMASYVVGPSEQGKARLDHLLHNFLKEVILLEAVTCLVFLMVATKRNASKCHV